MSGKWQTRRVFATPVCGGIVVRGARRENIAFGEAPGTLGCGSFANTFMESFWNRTYIESVQITMAEDFGVQGRGAFYDETGAIRDVVQNHLFQVLTNLAMEPPVRTDSESFRDEKVKILKAIPPLEAKNLVRGQFRGYRKEKGVAPDSQVETFAALRLDVNSWRWQGVPFYIRAGKSLPVTCTELVVRLRPQQIAYPFGSVPGFTGPGSDDTPGHANVQLRDAVQDQRVDP